MATALFPTMLMLSSLGSAAAASSSISSHRTVRYPSCASNMLRSRPTTLSITTTELKDFELRSRYRKYLRSTGEAPANGKAPVRVPKGPFDDRLVLPRPRDADHDASPDGSDLEADLLLDFDPMRASSTREETGIDLHVESAVDLAQESPSESERAQLLERGDDETGQPETARQQILRPGPARDPAVVLPPPFSSRPRALTVQTCCSQVL